MVAVFSTFILFIPSKKIIYISLNLKILLKSNLHTNVRKGQNQESYFFSDRKRDH